MKKDKIATGLGPEDPSGGFSKSSEVDGKPSWGLWGDVWRPSEANAKT